MRLLIAGVLVSAAIPKIVEPAAFALAIHRYQLLTPAWIQPLALVLPWLEIVAAAALLAPPPWRRSAGWLILAMLLVFLSALGSAWWRGLEINCGCFGTATEVATVGAWHVGRDVLLLAATVWAAGLGGRRKRWLSLPNAAAHESGHCVSGDLKSNGQGCRG